MKIWDKIMLFALGGTGYMGLEVLWRGYSHGSMFLAGGSCFLIFGLLNKTRLPLPLRAAVGAGAVTAVELLTGLIANRNYTVWDYRGMPYHFQGQICLPFSLLWYPVSVAGMLLYDALEKRLPRRLPK